VTNRTPDRVQDQTVSEAITGRLFDRLAGPKGLTEHASSFSRPDVLVALGAGLAGAGRTDLEELADRFLAEQAVSVVSDRTLEERRWSTPDLLAVEHRLVAAATGRTGAQTAVASHQAVREALATHATAGPDQQAMVRDLCQGDAGVALVVGRAGTGKTFALGIARHAWQLDGYRLLAAALTGIATMSLQGEGFEEVATCDRLLGDLDRGREQLDPRTVVVVDEAGMVGSRKLARLLEHAQQARAKVVLVGDDRQLASIDAGGGFRALRLRLGASELTENRRQQQAWEREALDLVRSGLVEEAVAAYEAHDRVVAADSKPAATLALLQDWWTAYQDAEHDPAQEVIVLAARRAEVDRLNTACQELLAAQGRLGGERLQVEDRQLAVGDRVVCGHNAIAELGVANGSRGTIIALDPQARTLTLRLDGTDSRTVTLPRSYLDGRRQGERNRRVDLAYATTGHRAQGLTRGRALVRLTGSEDVNWLYVQLSRARQDTRLYAVVGPEPQGIGELDLPDRDQPDAYLQLAQALSRAGGQRLAIDTPTSPDLQRLSTAELRAERDRLRHLDQMPRDRSRELARATAHRQHAEEAMAAHQPSTDRQPAGMLGWLRRGDDQSARMPGGLAVATQQANRAHDRERELRQHQQRRDGWVEANADLGPQDRQVMRTLAWRRRATGLAIEAERPGYVLEALGPCPSRPGAGGPGATPPPKSSSTDTPTASPIRCWPSARSRPTEPSGPLGSGPRRPSSASRPSSGHPTAPAMPGRPASERPSRELASSVAGAARSGPPASPPGRSIPMASSRPWPFNDDDDRPSGSVRPLSHADLQAILAHLNNEEPDELLAGTGADRPVVAMRVRASVGRPGGSAQATWRRVRAAEWAAWTRTLPWRVAVLLGIGVGGGVLGSQLAPRWGLVLGVLAVVVAGWGLRFRPSPDAVAWRRGAAGERRTARLLGQLEWHGWAALHDLALPGSRANLDHLVIGPGGVFVIDSKHYRGHLRLDGSGRLWHGRYPLAPILRAVDFEADQAARVLTDPDVVVVVVPIVAVHGAQVPWGKVVMDGVPVVAARRLPSMLRQLPAVLGPERVAALTSQARIRFHTAA
jgi:AAA domain/Nuclease-related domain